MTAIDTSKLQIGTTYMIEYGGRKQRVELMRISDRGTRYERLVYRKGRELRMLPVFAITSVRRARKGERDSTEQVQVQAPADQPQQDPTPQTPEIDANQKTFTSREAASYLGISLNAVRHHLRHGHIQATLVHSKGKAKRKPTWTITRKALDEYAATRKGR